MRHFISISIVASTLFACVAHSEGSTQDFVIDDTVVAAGAEPFLRHEQPGPFGSYLAMSIPFAPVKKLHADLEASSGLTLISRGEAHITVVTPIEYDQALKTHLSIKEIGDLAEAAGIQSSAISLVCVGRGEKVVGHETLVTYYLVTDAEPLLALRLQIHQAFVQAGGAPAAFNPETFYPHITVGFTKRDLHFEDGIKKDRNSCVADLVRQ